jgi:hypothetical protein
MSLFVRLFLVASALGTGLAVWDLIVFCFLALGLSGMLALGMLGVGVAALRGKEPSSGIFVCVVAVILFCIALAHQ